MHDARVGHAALVHLALPAAERCVARHRPTPRVVVVGARPAQLVDARPQLAASGGQTVPEAGVVDRPAHAALGAGTVVGYDDHDGVVTLAELVDEREHAPDLRVGVREEAGEALHEPRVDAPVLRLEVGPCRYPWRAR